jgi:hypothetical protein
VGTTKHTLKIAIILFVTALFLSAQTILADALPTEEDIDSLAGNAKLTSDTFIQQSFNLRMQYEYSGRFLTEADKEHLYELAQDAGDKLQTIIEKQKSLKRQIEDYQGDDWDQKYGSTGLWRKLSADIYASKLNKFEIDYYLALASEHPQQEQTLHSILSEIDSFAKSSKQSGPNLTRGKMLAMLSQIKPSYKDAAVKEFEAFSVYSDVYRPTAAAIEEMKLLGSPDTNQLNILVKRLQSNWNESYLELVLSLMFLQRQCDPKGFEETVRSRPQTKDFVGSLALADLANRFGQKQIDNLGQISVFEAELAAQAAWKNETRNYKELLSRLSNTEKFKTPLILYVTATALAESSPAEAVALLVKAGKLQQQQKSNELNIEAGRIAEQAAQLAYNIFTEDLNNCPVILEAFDNYCTIAGEKIDEELEYLYTIILNSCGENTKNREVLEKIAGWPEGKLSSRAKLDLILQAMQKSTGEPNKMLEQLENFILSCRGQDETNSKLRAEAINIYCKTIFESKNKTSTEKMIETLTRAENTAGVNIDLLKAQTLQRLGKLDESARCMLSAIKDDSGSLAPAVSELLAEVVEKIDEFETQPANPDSLEIMENCKKLAQFCYSNLNDRQSGLFLAEISILAADKNREKLLEADNLLNKLASDGNDVDLLRCKARLACEKAEFDKASSLWAKIAEMQKNKSPQTYQENLQWWQAKYYELYCLSKCPQVKSGEILHTIEVLENSFTDIPPPWAENLKMLKQKLTDSGK